ncbi:hypothetical protein KY345_01135 [Candidatus Woesearchaeota archaeon]|nr:hypothetical protein [Candidatus Woesearchaeota archaeon]
MNVLKVILGIIGAVTILLSIFFGYQAFQAGNYVGLFIPLIVLTFGINVFFLGLHGRRALSPLAKKLVSMGLGFFIIAVFLGYISGNTGDVRVGLENAMIDTIAEASAEQVEKQLASEEFPDKETVRMSCASQTEPADERSFTMQDLCGEIDREENENKSVEEIMQIALDKKTRRLAEEQVRREISENQNFNKMFDDMEKSSRFVFWFGAVGVLMFILGIVFRYYGKDDRETILDTVYAVSFASVIVCIINAVIFRVIDYFIKSQLMTGKIMESQFLQGMMPAVQDGGEVAQQVTRTMLIKTGEVIYNWLGAGLNAAFLLSIVLGAVFLVLAIVFYIVSKREVLQKRG